MKTPALKVCGMKYNTQEVAALRPEYLGFIFYEKSPRYSSEVPPSLPNSIKKVGVFVNASLQEVRRLIEVYDLSVCQLHGNESVAYMQELREIIPPSVQLWKVFAVGSKFDVASVTPFETIADAFLFDTKGDAPGGNGVRFSWELLKSYSLSKPIIISGGIGREHIEEIHTLLNANLPIHAIDVNSRFETKPGHKNIQSLKDFQDALSR